MKSTHITFLEVMILKWKPGFKIENIWKIMAKKERKKTAVLHLSWKCYVIKFTYYIWKGKNRFVPQFVATSESSWGYDPPLRKNLPPPANTLGKAVGNNKTRAS